MAINWLATFVAAFVPMIIGAIYYNPKVMGTAWMNASGMTEEKAKNANMAKVYGFALLFSFMIALSLNSMVIHQLSVASIFQVGSSGPAPGSEEERYLADFLARYGHLYRTFGHGMLHGLMGGLFLSLPIIATNSLFEMKSWKYIFINVGYWCISMMIMGGIICAWK